MKRAYARDVLGLYHNNARKGTSWLLSELQDDRNFKKTSDLSSWRLSRGIIDIVVVVLDATGVQHDFLELHFVKPLNREAKELLDSLFPTLVRAWARRKSGLVTQAQIDDRIIVARANAEARRIKPDEAILGISNPARLSRAEFRVCLLMSRGLSIKGVTDELGLSESTIRSHLRSIYSKTAVTGVAELVYRLVSNTADDRPASHRSI
ncbi:helix-turn-helix transcriptional regulator [Boseongicola aestuarii]|uniref:helix-turn-helix transcriptional regulator n=1 Tax=Boseongicola aestuarii TaxID=1470561 RepID=UPI0015954BF3|nr:helix-turn-helix transcriptional regulator [Boseongicola aestuarii]